MAIVAALIYTDRPHRTDPGAQAALKRALRVPRTKSGCLGARWSESPRWAPGPWLVVLLLDSALTQERILLFQPVYSGTKLSERCDVDLSVLHPRFLIYLFQNLLKFRSNIKS